jgi:hypothetical protein
LANSDVLIIRADRREPLRVLPLWLAAEVAAVAEQIEALEDKADRYGEALQSQTVDPQNE